MPKRKQDRLLPEQFIESLREVHQTLRFTLCVVLVFVLVLISILISPESLGLILDFLRELFPRVRT
jgi:hypothetical protein